MFDAHAHLRPTSDSVTALIQRMDELGIEKAVIVGGGLLPPDILAESIQTAKQHDVSFDHEKLECVLEGFEDRLFPFFFGNPISGLGAYVENGNKYFGLKLAPAIHGVPFGDPRILAMISVAERLSHPVYLHCLNASGFRVKDLISLASRFQNVKFILGHAGVGHMDFGAVDLIKPLANIYFETSGGYLAVAKYAYSQLGADRMLFGSEYPLQDPAIEQAKARLIGMPNCDYEKYTERNIQLLLAGRLNRRAEEDLRPKSSFRSSLAQAALKHARGTPFFRERFPSQTIKEYSDWNELPFMTKDDLRSSYPFGLLAVPRCELATYHESTGTTGIPSSTYFTERDWDDVVTRFLRNGVGVQASDTVLIKTPYSMVTTALQMHLAARRANALVIPADNRSSNMPYTKVVRLLKDLQVSVAWCMPSEVALWASTAKLLGFDPASDFPHLRAFIVAGEPLSDTKRRRLEDLWGAKPIYVDYGSTETGSLAGDCGHQHMHAWSDRLLYEVRDLETGRTSLSGNGELVVTSYFRRGMPLIRYRTGDLVELGNKAAACACGSSLTRLKVKGRLEPEAPRVGKQLLQRDLEQAVYELPADYGVLYWRAKFQPHGLEVEIEADEGFEEIACDELAAIVYQKHRINTKVTAVVPWSIVSRDSLLQTSAFKKPRYLFQKDENWTASQSYL